MPEMELQPDETLVEEWHPRFSVFLRKLIFVAFVTSLFLGGIGSWFGGGLYWLAGLPLAMACYVLIFDDYTEWMRHRKDIWQLTNQRLIFQNGLNGQASADVALTDIRQVKLSMWWALKLGLSNGQTTVMKFLPGRENVRTAITAARARCLETANG